MVDQAWQQGRGAKAEGGTDGQDDEHADQAQEQARHNRAEARRRRR
jgi:hypothetical protein